MTHPELPAFLLADRNKVGDRPNALLEAGTHSQPPGSRRRKKAWTARGLLVLALVGLVGVGWWGYRSKIGRGESPTAKLPMIAVAKANLSSVLTAFGRVESSHNTVISCEIERLDVGRTLSSGGASTILSLVDEGTEVKKGDILCSLDASDYEEIVRLQELRAVQAAAALRQAQLNFEVAEIAVREYREGLMRQDLQSMEGSIVLAKSDVERAIDRLRWTETMLAKGYLPIAKKADAVQTLSQYQLDLETSQFDLNNYLKYGNPRRKMELEAEVEKRRFEVIANTQRVARNEERLEYYRKILGFCTIRAPHDGFLIYAVDGNRPGAMPLEAGQTVRQSQKLFYLPDMGKMEVLAYLHESVATQIHEGMRAKAKIEGLSNRTLEGHVVSVAPLPTSAGNWISNEVKYFVGVVRLDSVPQGMRPGMSAEVEFDVERCLDVLAVPSEAIAFEQGHNVCYVAGAEGLERRSVTLGRSTRDLLEVTKGLAEGEQVVLRPEKIDSIESLVVHSKKDTIADPSASPEPSGAGTAPVTVD